MNRLDPLIRRRQRSRASFAIAVAAVRPTDLELPASWLQDAKLFAGGWVAGLVLFGTLFG